MLRPALLALLALALVPTAANAARMGAVDVVKTGPAKARNVLVLVPGTFGGAGSTDLVGRDIARRARGWQVWSIDRRENRLEDRSQLDRALRGEVTAQQLFDYYLGWLTDNTVTPHYEPPAAERTDAAREWGMRTAVRDMRPVIRAARRKGGKVVLGGHSLGGTIATAYATWDFGGRPGGRALDGLVLIDGGSGGRDPLTADEARQRRAEIDSGSPFLDLTGTGVPWALGAFATVGGAAAVLEPDALSVFEGFPLLPQEFRPPVPVTNAAALGHTVDTETGSERLALIQVHAGALAAEGDPRPWVDGELVPVRRVGRLFARRGIDGVAWFHPARLSLDAGAVNNGVKTDAQEVLGLRTTRGRALRIPIYAFQTSLSDGRVLRGARELAQIGDPRFTRFVDRAETTAHLDPVAAAPRRNAFLKTVLPFLKRIARR